MSAPALILEPAKKTALHSGFVAGIDGALGAGACHVLSIRPQGGVKAAE